MRKLVIAALAVIALYLAAHRSAAHAAITGAAVTLAAVAGLCVLTASAVALRGRLRSRPAPVRHRAPAVQPATVSRPRAVRPCEEGCGRPATRRFGRYPVCEDCGGRLDQVAGSASDRDEPAGWLAVGRAFADYETDEDPGPAPSLTQPPVLLPPGESAGNVDMTDFEKDYLS